MAMMQTNWKRVLLTIRSGNAVVVVVKEADRVVRPCVARSASCRRQVDRIEPDNVARFDEFWIREVAGRIGWHGRSP